ncbi:MAG: selenocysteine-specific translation elongation factor [Defluviitaleaceae bacterium]|nr:selenocysteine-specific translation elongation factor [Defluviitaleaceae bacterium]MCL2275593.1 selenocysteine-specific translation elongation factor [Defluviitaleaceae bacterium]
MKKHVLIGTAGHVDHGKTTLITALTGIEHDKIDRLKEEKKRGITIDLGYACLPLPDGGVASIIDVPGHEKFIKNMLAGASGIDLVLLVIASDDGVMPQTREHLSILQLLNAQSGIIVLTKCDVTDEDWRTLVKEDIRALTKNTFLGNAPIVEVSARTGSGILELKSLILTQVTSRNLCSPQGFNHSRLPIDRVFSVEGFGTVVTGTLTEGTLHVGETVHIFPANTPAKVRNIQVHGGDVAEAFAGQRAAVNLSGIRKEDVKRGDILAPADALHPTRMLDVRLEILPDSPREVKNNTRLHFYHGTFNALCKAVLLHGTTLKAGQSTYAQLRFTEDIAVKQGDRFVVRFYSPMETVGGGIILHTQPQKHRRAKANEIEKRLTQREQAQKSGDICAQILQRIADGSPNLTPLDEIKKNNGSAPVQFDEAVTTLMQAGKVTRISETHVIDEGFRTQFAARLTKQLAAYHAANPLQRGIRREELRGQLLPKAKPALFDALLHIYEATHIRVVEGRVASANFSIQLTPAQQQIRDDICTRLQSAPYMPPAMEELQALWQKKTADFRQVMDALQAEGAIITTEAGIFFHASTVTSAKEIFTQLYGSAPTQNVTLALFRDTLGTSRKFALSLLEYFDRTGFTRKEGEGRVLKT